MKKSLCIIFILCLLLNGCNDVVPEQTEAPDFSASQTQEELETTVAQTQEVQQPSESQMPTIGGITMPEIELGQNVPESDISLGDTGRIRLSYTGNRNSVRYITDVSGLVGYPELAEYDEAYFEKNALLLVIVTENSGSIKTEIGAVQVTDGTASVYVSRKMDGDAGTMDMATWLMWVEVEAGLEYEWTLANVNTNANDNVSKY